MLTRTIQHHFCPLLISRLSVILIWFPVIILCTLTPENVTQAITHGIIQSPNGPTGSVHSSRDTSLEKLESQTEALISGPGKDLSDFFGQNPVSRKDEKYSFGQLTKRRKLQIDLNLPYEQDRTQDETGDKLMDMVSDPLSQSSRDGVMNHFDDNMARDEGYEGARLGTCSSELNERLEPIQHYTHQDSALPEKGKQKEPSKNATNPWIAGQDIIGSSVLDLSAQECVPEVAINPKSAINPNLRASKSEGVRSPLELLDALKVPIGLLLTQTTFMQGTDTQASSKLSKGAFEHRKRENFRSDLRLVKEIGSRNIQTIFWREFEKVVESTGVADKGKDSFLDKKKKVTSRYEVARRFELVTRTIRWKEREFFDTIIQDFVENFQAFRVVSDHRATGVGIRKHEAERLRKILTIFLFVSQVIEYCLHDHLMYKPSTVRNTDPMDQARWFLRKLWDLFLRYFRKQEINWKLEQEALGASVDFKLEGFIQYMTSVVQYEHFEPRTAVTAGWYMALAWYSIRLSREGWNDLANKTNQRFKLMIKNFLVDVISFLAIICKNLDTQLIVIRQPNRTEMDCFGLLTKIRESLKYEDILMVKDQILVNSVNKGIPNLRIKEGMSFVAQNVHANLGHATQMDGSSGSAVVGMRNEGSSRPRGPNGLKQGQSTSDDETSKEEEFQIISQAHRVFAAFKCYLLGRVPQDQLPTDETCISFEGCLRFRDKKNFLSYHPSYFENDSIASSQKRRQTRKLINNKRAVFSRAIALVQFEGLQSMKEKIHILVQKLGDELHLMLEGKLQRSEIGRARINDSGLARYLHMIEITSVSAFKTFQMVYTLCHPFLTFKNGAVNLGCFEMENSLQDFWQEFILYFLFKREKVSRSRLAKDFAARDESVTTIEKGVELVKKRLNLLLNFELESLYESLNKQLEYQPGRKKRPSIPIWPIIFALVSQYVERDNVSIILSDDGCRIHQTLRQFVQDAIIYLAYVEGSPAHDSISAFDHIIADFMKRRLKIEPQIISTSKRKQNPSFFHEGINSGSSPPP